MVEQNLDYNAVWDEQDNQQALDNFDRLQSQPEVEEEETPMQIEADVKVISSHLDASQIVPQQTQQMSQNITPEQHLGIAPMIGSLEGGFQDCLNYLDWSINVFGGKGNLTSDIKGRAFYNAIQTLKDKFGVQISTHYLKQFCEKQKRKNLHIAYMLRLAEMKTSPVKTNFKGAVVNGRRCIVPKIFDMVITKEEWDSKELQAQKFKELCLAEFEAKRQSLEQQKLNVQKLQIVSNLAEEEINHAELEELAPDLKATDREMVKRF